MFMDAIMTNTSKAKPKITWGMRALLEDERRGKGESAMASSSERVGGKGMGVNPVD
jgi:hypothetical protein